MVFIFLKTPYMQSSIDPRHTRRIELMQSLFTYSFQSTNKNHDIKDILTHIPTIDTEIQKSAPEWPVDKIARIDLAILRLAVYELIIQKSEPPKVVIDEAIELAKTYGNTHSHQFINGVLGTVYKTVYKDDMQKAEL